MSRLFPNPDARLNGNPGAVRAASREGSDPKGSDRTAGAEVPDLELGHSPEAAGEDLSEVGQLRIENTRLRALVAEMEKQLDEGGPRGDSSWEERQKEYESLLEEKSEVIRSLHRKIQELHDHPGGGGGGAAAGAGEQELLALSEELEQERRQLKDDEEALMQQMREMEVQMAKERAEMARQRNEVLRLQSEIRHELELANRDAALRERLAPLQRRHQELANRRGSGPPPIEPPPNAAPQAAAPAEPAPAKRDSFLGRLFGKGGG